jgi:hypothetical protein
MWTGLVEELELFDVERSGAASCVEACRRVTTMAKWSRRQTNLDFHFCWDCQPYLLQFSQKLSISVREA